MALAIDVRQVYACGVVAKWLKYNLGKEVVFAKHRQTIFANTDTQLIIIIVTLFRLFTKITLSVFGKTLCPCQSL